jgi:hypothetical protein
MFIRRQFDYDCGSIVVKEVKADPIAEAEQVAKEFATAYVDVQVKRRDEGADFGEQLEFPHFDIVSGNCWLETIFICSE